MGGDDKNKGYSIVQPQIGCCEEETATLYVWFWNLRSE